MKTSTKIIIFLVLSMLLVAPAQATFLNDLDSKIRGAITGLTISSYSSSVPVQIGYDKTQNFWVITGTIGWSKDQLTLIKLPASTSDKIDGTTDTAKAQRETLIQFDPKGSYETAPITRADIHFRQSAWNNDGTAYGSGSGVSQAYKVETGAWITKTVYSVAVNGQWQTVEVGMTSAADVNLRNGVFVKNLGILPNGANFPGGNWMFVYNPDSRVYELYTTTDVQNSITYWNNNYPLIGYGSGWAGVWQFLKDKNRLPSKPVMTAISMEPITENGDYKYIKLTYPKVAQSSMIALYVPSSLADTIIINMGGSKGVIVGTPVITEATDKQRATLTLTVRNNGGDDYITVKPTSNYYQFSAIGEGTKSIKNGETAQFTFSAYALDVSSNCLRCASINILVDGTDPYSGDSGTVIYGTIYDGDDTPTGATTWKLTIRSLKPDGTVLTDAPIYINNELIGKGQTSAMKPRGDYIISSQNTSGLFAPSPATVTMNGQDITQTLQFTTAPQVDIVDLTWIFWGVLGLIVAYIAFKQGFIAFLTKNPSYLILVAFMVFILYMLYQILLMIYGIGETVNTAAANPWLPWNWGK